MYAFLSHQSACEVLRYVGDDVLNLPAWPSAPRRLPRYGDSVSTQRSFGLLNDEVDLSRMGITGTPVHLLVPTASDRSRGKRALFHVWQRDVPANAMVRVDAHVFASTPPFILMQMATHNSKADPLVEKFLEDYRAAQLASPDGQAAYDDPFEWALMERLVRMALVACEFAGSYRLAAGDKNTTYDLAPLMTCEDAYAFARSTPRPYGIKRLQTALDLAFNHSASPMESALALMLTLPPKMGGYGLPRPTLNEELSTGEWAAFWDGGDIVTPDLLWREARLAIEYESDEFHGSKGPKKAAYDARRGNVLTAMGYSVLRVTKEIIVSRPALGRLAGQVAAHLGVLMAPEDDETLIRRQKLHLLLMRQGQV